MSNEEIRFSRHQIQLLSAQQTRHSGHLALNGKTLQPISFHARGGAFASVGRAIRRPFGLARLLNRHPVTSGGRATLHTLSF